jgi:hypothetical protein
VRGSGLGPRTPALPRRASPLVELGERLGYGPAAERERPLSAATTSPAGTQAVWDADVLRSEVVSVYRAADPSNSTVYRRGQFAEAEPAVPGWAMLVDGLFA